MLNMIALSITLCFIAWLFVRDRRIRSMTSWGLWVTLAWVLIVGTRTISSWLGIEIDETSADALVEGTPLDRNVLLILIILGAVALYRRKPDWRRIFNSNRWFFAFFAYCAVSIVWSDFPFVSFKRWIKELGNIIMVLIIVTENNPVQATRAVFARYTNVVIPLSLVLIYFFPEISTNLGDELTDLTEMAYGGVATNKNTLGIIAFICSQFLVWELIHVRSADGKPSDKIDVCCRIVLLSICTWLMYLANSMTSLICLIVGVGIIVATKLHFGRRQIRYLGTYGLLMGLLMLVVYFIPGILEAVIDLFHRDMTLTGRSEMWAELLDEPINPLLGTGYQSFWLGSRAEILWEKYLFHPTQAHNGYLETYLNGGLVGVGLLLATIFYTGSKLKRIVWDESGFTLLLISFLVTALFYNWTEARFGGLNILWIILSIAALYHPMLHGTVLRRMVRPAGAGIQKPRGPR